MGVPVQRGLVPLPSGAPREVLVPADIPSEHEEGAAGVVAREEVEKRACRTGVGSVVEREREPVRHALGAAEQVPARPARELPCVEESHDRSSTCARRDSRTRRAR